MGQGYLGSYGTGEMTYKKEERPIKEGQSDMFEHREGGKSEEDIKAEVQKRLAALEELRKAKRGQAE
jgi:hypothetical protein